MRLHRAQRRDEVGRGDRAGALDDQRLERLQREHGDERTAPRGILAHQRWGLSYADYCPTYDGSLRAARAAALLARLPPFPEVAGLQKRNALQAAGRVADNAAAAAGEAPPGDGGGAGPGAMVTKMQLFSFYGTGAQPPAGW